MMETLDTAALLRTVLILAHLLTFAAAAVGTAFGDYALFLRRRVDLTMLRRAMVMVSGALATLWVTGALIVWLDTGFDWDVLLTRPKLLAKLTVVTLLSLNGYLLHRFAFPHFEQPSSNPLRAAALPSLLGAVSAATWLYAAFLGVAKALTPVLGYAGFLQLYGGMLLMALLVSWFLIRPRLAQRLTLLVRSGPEPKPKPEPESARRVQPVTRALQAKRDRPPAPLAVPLPRPRPVAEPTRWPGSSGDTDFGAFCPTPLPRSATTTATVTAAAKPRQAYGQRHAA